MKVLDCTLRDGGYYSNWDFPKDLVKKYLQFMANSPVEYVELGYRTPPQKIYYGEYFYTPLSRLVWAKNILGSKKIAVMMDQKNVREDQVQALLEGCSGLLDLVRLTVDPNDQGKIQAALMLAKKIKELGYQVAFNLMYLSKINSQSPVYRMLDEISEVVDFLYLVDSYGSIFPEQLGTFIEEFSAKTTQTLGFHGHNNIEMAFSNTLKALEKGVGIVDSTIMGMGRGAGNLKTELLFSYLFQQGVSIDLNALSDLLQEWKTLYEEYEWGTCFPYMTSGMHSLPQKDVMDWMGKRRYSIGAIVRALQQFSQIKKARYLSFCPKSFVCKKLLFVGGGKSVLGHLEGVLELIKKDPKLLIIHLSSKFLAQFQDLNNPQILCLVGTEGRRLDKKLSGDILKNIKTYVLPASPRKMGAYVPHAIEPYTVELQAASTGELYKDSPLAIASEIALSINAEEVYLIGCDGYEGSDYELLRENQTIFKIYQERGLIFSTLVPSFYEGIRSKSLYGILGNDFEKQAPKEKEFADASL